MTRASIADFSPATCASSFSVGGGGQRGKRDVTNGQFFNYEISGIGRQQSQDYWTNPRITGLENETKIRGLQSIPTAMRIAQT